MPTMDIFAFVFDPGSLHDYVWKPPHQLLGLSIACHPLATYTFPCVLNAAYIYVAKAKISMSKNNIYPKNFKSSHTIDGVEVVTRPVCTLIGLFLYLNRCQEIQKKATSKTVFSNFKYTFSRKMVKKI